MRTSLQHDETATIPASSHLRSSRRCGKILGTPAKNHPIRTPGVPHGSSLKLPKPEQTPLGVTMTKNGCSMEWVSQRTVLYSSARQLKLPEGRVEPGRWRFAHANCGMYVFREICTARGSGSTDESGCRWGESLRTPPA